MKRRKSIKTISPGTIIPRALFARQRNQRKAGLFLGLMLMQACSPQEPQEAKRPNILFAIADDASFPYMGAYGCAWVKTPAFDRVAREGLLFTRAYTPNAKCAPSRASILTGRNSWQLEEAGNHVAYFPARFKTYAETLSEQGYHVGYTGKGWAPGDPGEVNGKKRELSGPVYSKHTTDPPAGGISDNDYAANFREFLDDRQEGEAFCFWYGGLEPHRGYEFRSGLEKGGKQLSDIDQVPPYWPDVDSVRADMLDYAYELEYFDRHLGQMLDMLEEAGELENTLVVVTADNGMPFPREKGQEYEYSNHMPLAVMWPAGIRDAGRQVDDFVSFIDFAPTFLELAGISADEGGMEPVTGSSLTGIFNRSRADEIDPDRTSVLIGKERHDVGRPRDQGYPIRGIVTGEFLYLHNFEPDRWPAGNPETGYLNTDGGPTKSVILNRRRVEGEDPYWDLAFGKRPREELYEIASDPECMHNLAGEEAYLEVAEELKQQLFERLEDEGDPRMSGQGHLFDEYPYAQEARRNFYERYMAGEEIQAGWVNKSDFETEFKK